MKVMGADARAAEGRGRQFYLRPELTLEEMLRRLAVDAPPSMAPEDSGPSPDGKCEHQVYFYVGGVLCGFWDYRGERWPAFGPRSLFMDLGWYDDGR